MQSRLFVFDGPGHGREVDFHGGSIEIKAPDGRCQRYELLTFRLGDSEFRLLAPPHTRNHAGLQEFVDEYDVRPCVGIPTPATPSAHPAGAGNARGRA
jgi:hypothetical protein